MAALTVRLIGGPTAVLELGGVRLVTDPTFSPSGSYETGPGRFLTKTEDPAIALSELGTIDLVLLSHDQHADNLDPAGRSVVAQAPLTLTTATAAGRLGGTAQALANWDTISIDRRDGGTLKVTGVPARHGPPGCEPITGEVTGFVLHGEGLQTVYVSGDNASLEIVYEIADRVAPIDVALLFAGAARTSLFDGEPLTLTSREAAEAARILDAPIVVPMHVRGWGHFTQGPDSIASAFEAAGEADRLCQLQPGESFTLSDQQAIHVR